MSIETVRRYFAQFGLEKNILEFDASSATVALAAEAVGVIAARIAKTLAFYAKDGGAVLVVCAGDVKIDNSKFKQRFGLKAKMLTSDDLLRLTGHAVGGVCPFALPEDSAVTVYTDVSLKRFTTVFPACGNDHSAIELTLDQLFQYAGASEWVDVCKMMDNQTP